MVMPVLPAGHIPTGAELEQWSDQIDFLTNPPMCIVTRSTAQTGIVTATPTDISFDTEVTDDYGMFTPTSATITLSHTGLWLVSAYCAIESNATGYRRLLLNHAAAFVIIDARPAVNGDASHMTIQGVISATAADTIKVAVEQTSGANRATAGTPRLAVKWLGSG